MRTLFSLGILVLLTGCATLNQPECESARQDPARLGLEDGQMGYGLWRLDKHIESCARFDIRFDRAAYLAAREQGLLHYCTPDNGERVGARGESYENVCPAALEPAFLARYRPAYREYLNQRDNRFWYPWPMR